MPALRVQDDRGNRLELAYTRSRFDEILREHTAEVRRRTDRRFAATRDHASATVARRPMLQRVGSILLMIPFGTAGGVAIAVGGAAFIAVLLAFLVGPLVLIARATAIPASIRFGVVVGLLVIAVIVMIARHRMTWPSRSARDLVSRMLCGACGYSLDRLPADDDGCTVCPECGAAWKLWKEGVVRCVECEASLIGTPVAEDGHVYCPGCDLRHFITPSDDV